MPVRVKVPNPVPAVEPVVEHVVPAEQEAEEAKNPGQTSEKANSVVVEVNRFLQGLEGGFGEAGEGLG